MPASPDPRHDPAPLPRLVDMGQRRAVQTIVGSSVVAAVLLVLILMAVLGIPNVYWVRGALIAAIVSLVISGVVASWVLDLLFEYERTSLELAESARRDSLTQLYNRGYFLSRLADAISRAQNSAAQLSLLMIDVDHFKAVNDEYGHPAGDRVLKALAATCQQALSEEDMLARFGGEEFTVMLPDLPATEAFEQAERLRQRISALRVPIGGGQTVKVTASIGVSTLAMHEAEYRPLVERADRALYRAKSEGRDRSVYEHAPAISLVPQPGLQGRGVTGD